MLKTNKRKQTRARLVTVISRRVPIMLGMTIIKYYRYYLALLFHDGKHNRRKKAFVKQTLLYVDSKDRVQIKFKVGNKEFK